MRRHGIVVGTTWIVTWSLLSKSRLLAKRSAAVRVDKASGAKISRWRIKAGTDITCKRNMVNVFSDFWVICYKWWRSKNRKKLISQNPGNCRKWTPKCNMISSTSKPLKFLFLILTCNIRKASVTMATSWVFLNAGFALANPFVRRVWRMGKKLFLFKWDKTFSHSLFIFERSASPPVFGNINHISEKDNGYNK